MSGAPQPEHLRHVEDVAALGYLLNAIAHDLNNLLTNLMLGADQVQYGGGQEAIDLLLDQVQRISGITRAVQRLGQRNMTLNDGVHDLGALFAAFAAWHGASRPGEAVEVDCEEGVLVKGSSRHFVHALSLMALATADWTTGPLHLRGAAEQRPRSAWAGSTETVPMAVVELTRGTVGTQDSRDFKSLVDGFFESERSPAEIALMAAWEVVRKARGRMKVRGGKGAPGVAVTLELPLQAAA